jgi:hypothetical protein
MVKGRTRTVTEIEDAPPAALMLPYVNALLGCPLQGLYGKKKSGTVVKNGIES